jgi:hypothetical protein
VVKPTSADGLNAPVTIFVRWMLRNARKGGPFCFLGPDGLFNREKLIRARVHCAFDADHPAMQA